MAKSLFFLIFTEKKTMKKLILASTSTLHGQDFLQYLLPHIDEHFKGCLEILFLPYARPGGISHEEYTTLAGRAFDKIKIKLKGIHEFDDPANAVSEAQGIFTGGGNTFVLVHSLYRYNLLPALQNAVNKGTPYLGTSAGSNIAGLTMKTTNDMPIVYPPSFNTLGFVPFNINPHYLDPDPTSTHKGETREVRIKEFHQFNNQPVVGLREGSWLEVANEDIILKGNYTARIFRVGKEPQEIESGSLLNGLS